MLANLQRNWITHTLLAGNKMVQPLWKTVWPFIVKLTTWLPCEPVITPWGIYPREIKTYIYTEICTWMFPAALFIIAKHWKQSTGLQWVQGQTGHLDLELQLSNKKEWTVDTCNHLDESVGYYVEQTPTPKCQSQKLIYCDSIYIKHSWNGNVAELENRLETEGVRD